MRDVFILLLVVGGLYYFFGCSETKHQKYDKGYESGWEQEGNPSKWSTKEEKQGYEDGLDDAWAYDSGYDDAYNGKGPAYKNDAFYMDGYREGKKDKRGSWRSPKY